MGAPVLDVDVPAQDEPFDHPRQDLVDVVLACVRHQQVLVAPRRRVHHERVVLGQAQ